MCCLSNKKIPYQYLFCLIPAVPGFLISAEGPSIVYARINEDVLENLQRLDQNRRLLFPENSSVIGKAKFLLFTCTFNLHIIMQILIIISQKGRCTML